MDTFEATLSPERHIKLNYNRVPQVTWDFWAVKLLAVTVGETGADFIIEYVGLGLANTTYIMSAVLAAVLVVQFAQRRYVPWAYWLAVVMVSVVGTLITDNLVDNLGVSLITTAVAFSAALATTFILWYVLERTLSIHTIYTVRREIFYWLAILFTFALGTAAGDLMSEELGLGYLPAAFVYGAILVVIAISYFALHMDSVLAFWLAYIVTRPAGASLGDFMSKPIDPFGNGGLGYGTITTSVLFLSGIVATIIYMTVTHDASRPEKTGKLEN